MKILKCKDISGVDCEFKAQGETDDEVVNAIFEHGSLKHKDILEKMSETEEERMFEKMNDMLSIQD